MRFDERVRDGILQVLAELDTQPESAVDIGPNELSFQEQLTQIREFAEEANEVGVAYESIVCLLESSKLVLSGPASISLLEVGLLFGFKTERAEDAKFDRRSF